jgi:hypothetical protein
VIAPIRTPCPSGKPHIGVARRKRKVRRHDADDLIRTAVEANGLTDCGGWPSEHRVGQWHAEQRHARRVVPFVPGGERASQHRTDAECLEDVGGHHDHIRAHRFALAREVHRQRDADVRAHRAEAPAHGPPVVESRRRRRLYTSVPLDLEQSDELLGLRERQGSEEDVIGEREGRRGGAGAQGGNEHRHHCEGRRLAKDAQRPVHVLPQQVGMHANGVAAHVGDGVEPERDRALVTAARREHRTHLVAVFGAERRRVQPEQEPIDAHHTLPGANPLSRASLTS